MTCIGGLPLFCHFLPLLRAGSFQRILLCSSFAFVRDHGSEAAYGPRMEMGCLNSPYSFMTLFFFCLVFGILVMTLVADYVFFLLRLPEIIIFHLACRKF